MCACAGYRGAVHDPVVHDATIPDPVIEARGLTKRFGRTVALEALDLTIEPGASIALLGENGAGKSVTLRLFAGLTRPTSGSIKLLGTAPTSRGGLAVRSRLGVLDQRPRFYEWMTGRELLAFTAHLLGIEQPEAGARIDAMLDYVGLTEAASDRIRSYPPGLRQFLGVAQAMLGKPDVLLLDEPLGGLDPGAQGEMLAVLGELKGTTTLVIATADLEVAEELCDRVAVLDAGRLVAAASTVELFDRVAPRHYVIETAAGRGLAFAGLVARIAREPWVESATASPGRLRVTVRDHARAERELLPEVVATGLPVLALRRDRPALSALLARLRGPAG